MQQNDCSASVWATFGMLRVRMWTTPHDSEQANAAELVGGIWAIGVTACRSDRLSRRRR